MLHTSVAKAALAEFGLQPMTAWPKYSPDLNPQENVWSWVEQALRKEEKKSDTFADFCRRLLCVSKRYTGSSRRCRSGCRRCSGARVEWHDSGAQAAPPGAADVLLPTQEIEKWSLLKPHADTYTSGGP